MNWTNVSTIKKYEIENYIGQGFFDIHELNLLPAYKMYAGIGYEDFLVNIEKIIYGSDDIDVLNLVEIMIVWCAFCKYISYDSIFSTLYFAKNKKTLFHKLKKIMNSEYFEKIKYEDGGEQNRFVYCLASEGLQYACELIPNKHQPAYLEEWKRRRKKSKGYVMHDYHGGMLFNNFVLTKKMYCYLNENKYIIDKDTGDYIKTDVTVGIGSPKNYFGIFCEQDTGTEEPQIIYRKVENYYLGGLIGKASKNVLMISYRAKSRGYLEKFYPYVFTQRCIDYVYTLLLNLKCDLLMLLCYFASNSYEAACNLKDEMKKGGMEQDKWNFNIEEDRIGLITITEFLKRCKYQGKKPIETLRMTAICARSIYMMMNLPENEQVYSVINDYTAENVTVKRENGRIVIDASILKIYKEICTDAICYNPFYLFLTNVQNHTSCMKRKNQLLEYLWGSYEEKICRYHEVLLNGTEIMIMPTNHAIEYYPVLLPESFRYFEKILAVLKKYFVYVNSAKDCQKHLKNENESNELYMPNYYKYSLEYKSPEESKYIGYTGEIYVENTYTSIAALFRIKVFLAKYLSKQMNERNITILCIVNNWNDAVNTALFFDYWENEDSISLESVKTKNGKHCIFKRKFNLCFVNKNDLMNVEKIKNPFYIVRRKLMEDGRYAGEGYGYASKKGIYHCQPDGSCAGFYKENINALVE